MAMPCTKDKIDVKISETRQCFLRALDFYSRKMYREALRQLFRSLTRNPFSFSSWTLTFKSLIRLYAPPGVSRTLKVTMDRGRYIVKYVDFLAFASGLALVPADRRKTNILFIVPHISPGGAERVLLNIAATLDDSFFCLYMITTDPEADNAWHTAFKKHFRRIVIPKKDWILWDNYFAHMIARFNIALVLTSNSSVAYKYVPYLKSRFSHLKIVDILHSEESDGALPLFDWLPPYLAARVCISSRLKTYMQKQYERLGVDSRYDANLKVIYNGVDPDKYRSDISSRGIFRKQYDIPQGVRIVAFIGRFSDEKNPLLFVEIGRRVIMHSPVASVRFVMAGDGPQLDDISALIRDYGISDDFILTGMIDSVNELLADTDLLLVVSKTEGMPLVVLEALAAEVPILSTDVGAVGEIVTDGVNGYLISPERQTAESFAGRIIQLFSDGIHLDELTQNARATIMSRFSLNIMGSQYREMFTRLVDER